MEKISQKYVLSLSSIVYRKTVMSFLLCIPAIPTLGSLSRRISVYLVRPFSQKQNKKIFK
jgi:hypothetical protein